MSSNLVDQWHGKGVHLWLEEGQVRYHAIGELDRSTLKALKQDKQALAEALAQTETRPSSPSQLLYYLMGRNQVTAGACLVPAVLVLDGPFCPERLEQAFRRLIGRYPVLRTELVLEGAALYQKIRPQTDFSLVVEDVATSSDEELHDLVREDSRNALKQEQGEWWRVRLLRRTPQQHILLLCAHHALCDAAGLRYRLQLLARLYRQAQWGSLPWPEVATAKDPEAAKSWWVERLAPVVEGRLLPRRAERARIEKEDCVRQTLLLERSRLEAFKQYAADHNSSLFALLSATLYLTLRRQADNDIILGTVADLRDGRYPEGRLGDETNFLPLRFPNQGGGFGAFLERVNADFWQMLDHGHLPFADLLQALGRTKLYNTVFLLQAHFQDASLNLAPPFLAGRDLPATSEPDWGLTATLLPTRALTGSLDLDLRVEACCLREGLLLDMSARPGFLSAEELQGLLDTWCTCLETLLSSTHEVDLEQLMNQRPPVINNQEAIPVVISANFTAEPIEPVLRFWGNALDLPLEPTFLPADQIFRQLHEPDSFCRGDNGTNIILLSPHAWLADGVSASRFPMLAYELTGLLRAFLEKGNRMTLVLCPDWGAGTTSSQAEVIKRFETRLLEAELPGLEVIPSSRMKQAYPKISLGDVRAFQAGRVPYSEEGYAALGSLCVRAHCAARRKPIKVIVLDCDNTLWRGVLGEDGPDGIAITPEFAMLQRFMLQQMERGVLLCLASKNLETDVQAVLVNHPDMLLRPQHIVASAIDWAPKSENIQRLARRLGLGLDSVLFIDDNPREIAEVRERLPSVVALQLPAPEEIPVFLEHLWLLDGNRKTAEDLSRTSLYRDHAEREQMRETVPDLATFLASLELQVSIREADEQDEQRLLQLSHRVNQFHTSLLRLTRDRYARFLQEGGLAWTVRVSDRFGDYGLSGVLLARPVGTKLRLEAMMLSCRSLGRGVEHHMLRFLADAAAARGLTELELIYVAGPRNQPARDFYTAVLGRQPVPNGENLLAVTEATAAIEAASRTEPSSSKSSPNEPITEPVEDRRQAWQMAALKWRHLPDLIDAVARPTNYSGSYRPPRNQTEERLAEVWGELLGLVEVGIDADFFELGGTSLQAVRLVSRIEQTFAVNLSLDEVLEAASLEDQACRIDHRIAGSEPLDDETTVAEMRADAQLPASIQPEGTPTSTPEHILLTGATGFLGAHLLRVLLEQTEATITCLVRARNTAEGQERILANLKHTVPNFATQASEQLERIVIVCGDLAQPQLGLDDPTWNELARTIDHIYHNGAAVNFAYPYRMLRGVNVLGTREIISLACTQRTKPVSMISSFAVFDRRWESAHVFPRETRQEDPTCYHTGYGRSKWAAEQLLQQAASRGLPVYLFRPGDITADLTAGRVNESDLIVRFLRGSLAIGALPDTPFEIQLMDANTIARAVVALSAGEAGQYHLTNPEPITLARIKAELQRMGHHLEARSFEQWLAMVRADEHNELAGLLPFLADRDGEAWSRLPRLDAIETARTLAARGLDYRGPSELGLTCKLLVTS